MSERIGVFLLSIVLVGVVGCSATLKRPSAKEYYQEAAEAFEDEDYLLASEKYQELLEQYPLNPYAEEAELKAAYGHFLEENYAEAITTLRDFERAFPTSQHMPFVKYFLGMANYEQIRTLDRDQAVTRKADGFFQQVIDRYPESAFVLQAEEKSKAARDVMAKHELYVANFNEKLGNAAATKARLRTLVERYSETDAAVEALGQLARILDDEGHADLADLAARAQAARQAQAARTAGGDEPQVDEPDAAASEMDGLLVSGVDPLLLLVSELKKQEDAERLARTAADTEQFAAEKAAEQEERALDVEFEDEEKSFEVGENYREEIERDEDSDEFEMSDTDAFEFEADFAADLEEESAQEDGAVAESDTDFSDDEELTLAVDDEDFELDADVEALEAAGVLSAEAAGADSSTADSVVPESETAGELAETQEEVRVESTWATDVSPVAEEPGMTEESALEARAVSGTVETLDGAGPHEEAREEMVAVDEGAVSTSAAVVPADADAPIVRIKIESGAEIRAARDAVLDIDIDSIDFEFEDE